MVEQQDVVAEGLRQELNGTPLHGFNCHRNVTVARDEDNWHVRPIDCDVLLQIKTIETGKSDVENQTVWDQDPRVTQKLLGGLE
jgi:hypothetical protein